MTGSAPLIGSDAAAVAPDASADGDDADGGDADGGDVAVAPVWSIGSKACNWGCLPPLPEPELAFKFRPRARPSALEDISAGDVAETLTIVTLRRQETILSERLRELPAGTDLRVLELGSGTVDGGGRRLRARVAAGTLEGWVTLATSSGAPLVRRRQEQEILRLCDVKVGAKHAVKSMTPVRNGESLNSKLITELDPGTVVEILELGTSTSSRARVAARAPVEDVEGWIGLQTSTGQLLVRSISEEEACSRTSGGTMRSSRVRTFLQLARAGDIEKLRRLVEQTYEAESPSSPPSLDCWSSFTDAPSALCNCGDVRGRTALMYAAAFHNVEVVRFLLADPHLRAAALDDTQKTALHHAARHPPSAAAAAAADLAAAAAEAAAERAQVEIVRLLIEAGISPEARDHNGCTALLLAAAAGNLEVLRTLLECGASVSVKDYAGHSALDYARDFGHGAAAALLEAEGVSGGANGEDDAYKAISPRLSLLTGVKDNTMPSPRSPSGGGTGAFRSALWTGAVAGEGSLQGQVIAVEEPPSVSPASQWASSRERALCRLMAVTGEATAPRELELAIQAATEAGVFQSDIQAAMQRVEVLKARARAFEQLVEAVELRGVEELRRAIAAADANEVPQSELDRARAILAEEEPKEAARARLKAAQSVPDVASMKAALEEARRVKLPRQELLPIEELLRGVESKEQAEEALKKAVRKKSIAQLRFAIKEAQTRGVDQAMIAKAQKVLREEEPKQQSRDELTKLVMVGASVQALEAALDRAMKAKLSADEAVVAQAEALLRVEKEKARLSEAVSKAVEESKGVDMGDADALKEAKAALQDIVRAAKEAGVAEESLRDAELRRRRLHNAVEDLKGSVRVFCRVRPLSRREKENGDTQVTKQVDNMTLQMECDKTAANYNFDAVFFPGTQEEVFEDCRDLVQSALDGYNVTMFAYGQTGAGKTFTMYGSPGNEGTAPRTISELFALIDRDRGRFKHTVMASMMELHRNELVDLLVPRISPRKSSTFGGSPEKQKYNIHVDTRTQDVHIEGLSAEHCEDAEALSELLQRGNRQRSVAATAMNDASSRSHLILMIRIVRVNIETHHQLQGKILMCDLAGSERLKRSMVEGDMQKEAIEINRSLTALGDVIEALTSGKSHVPYKNHKLTQVMQDSLGGTAKTLMFVNCSPASSNADETVNALKYASRAKGITNEVKRNTLRRQSTFSGSSS